MIDEKELLPINAENVIDYIQKISAFYVLHKADKTTLFHKIKQCASQFKLNIENIGHVQLVVTAFFNQENQSIQMAQQMAQQMKQDILDREKDVS